MKDVIVQYVAGAIVLIMVFLLVSDPNGTVSILGALSSANVSAINALQGGSPSAGPSQRRSAYTNSGR